MYDARMADLTRLTVNLTPKSANALNWLSKYTELSRTDVVNRAIQLYRWTETATGDGSQLALIRDDGHIEPVYVL